MSAQARAWFARTLRANQAQDIAADLSLLGPIDATREALPPDEHYPVGSGVSFTPSHFDTCRSVGWCVR